MTLIVLFAGLGECPNQPGTWSTLPMTMHTPLRLSPLRPRRHSRPLSRNPKAQPKGEDQQRPRRPERLKSPNSSPSGPLSQNIVMRRMKSRGRKKTTWSSGLHVAPAVPLCLCLPACDPLVLVFQRWRRQWRRYLHPAASWTDANQPFIFIFTCFLQQTFVFLCARFFPSHNAYPPLWLHLTAWYLGQYARCVGHLPRCSLSWRLVWAGRKWDSWTLWASVGPAGCKWTKLET